MEQLLSQHTILAAITIFLLRILDVSFGTIRTISLVNGRIVSAVILGFFEVLIWISVISGVMLSVKDSPILLLAYAAGFAAGNGVGILLEQRLAIGIQLVQLFSSGHGSELARIIRDGGQAVTVFTGEGRDGAVTMLNIACPRKKIRGIIKIAQGIDPSVFYVIESVAGLRRRQPLASNSTGWRSVAKKK